MYLSQPGRDLSVDLTGGYARDVWVMLQEIHGFTYVYYAYKYNNCGNNTYHVRQWVMVVERV